MSTSVGFAVLPIVVTQVSYISANVGEGFITDEFDKQGSITYFHPSTGLINNAPINRLPHASWTGGQFLSYFDVFYNRIHINPPALALGNLLTSQARNVEVFNAYFTPKNVTAFVQDGLVTGITVTQPEAVPYTLAPLQAVEYEFSISLSGPPTVSANYQWTIDGQEYNLPVTGFRVLVFPFPHNWEERITERLQWLTNTHTPYNGAEYRYGERSKPRQFFEMSHVLQMNSASRLRNLMLGWQSRLYAVPNWTSGVMIEGDATSGGFSVTADPSFGEFYQGGIAVLYADEDNYEALEIGSATPGLITFTSPLQSDWPKNSMLMPINLCRVLADQSIVDYNEKVVTAKMAWACDPIDTNPWLPETAAPLAIGIVELWLTEPNWRDNLETKVQYQANRLDFDTGAVNTSQVGDYVPEIYSHIAYLNGKQAISDFRAFALRRKGKLNPFFYPSFRGDFELAADIPNGAGGFRAKTNFDAVLMRDLGTHNFLAIFKTDGTVLTFPISDVTNVDSLTMDVVIDGVIGTGITIAQVKKISYMHVARLDTDEITFSWASPQLTEAGFTVTALQGSAP